MKKVKGIAVVFILLMAFSCSINPEAGSVDSKKQEVTESRGGLPLTKTVSHTGGIEYLRLRPENITPTFNAIKAGSRSYSYNDYNYAGVIKSDGFIVQAAPYHDGDVMVWKIKVTYSGVVSLKNPVDPVYKDVTVIEEDVILRMLGKDITPTLNGIKAGSRSIYYNRNGFTGRIYSNDFRVVSAPQSDGDYMIFKLDITYSGEVVKY